ncbi:MAG: OmpA family protein, partial [Steroidobacteraceae bacterium]
TLVVRAVDFEFNSAELTVPARQTLDEVAASLVKQPELKVEIQGYTDSTGSAEYNLHLSQKRSESVRSFLISKGVNPVGLTAKGFGKANPIATNATTEGRAENRRVVFQVASAPEHVKVVIEEATPASTEAAKQGEPERAKKEHQEN